MNGPMDGLLYLHCGECDDTIPEGEAMRDYARLSLALTPEGHLLVLCVRHDALVAFMRNDEIAALLQNIAAGNLATKGKKETLH